MSIPDITSRIVSRYQHRCCACGYQVGEGALIRIVSDEPYAKRGYTHYPDLMKMSEPSRYQYLGSVENMIWLCSPCTDHFVSNEDEYSRERLEEMKKPRKITIDTEQGQINREYFSRHIFDPLILSLQEDTCNRDLLSKFIKYHYYISDDEWLCYLKFILAETCVGTLSEKFASDVCWVIRQSERLSTQQAQECVARMIELVRRKIISEIEIKVDLLKVSVYLIGISNGKNKERIVSMMKDFKGSVHKSFDMYIYFYLSAGEMFSQRGPGSNVFDLEDKMIEQGYDPKYLGLGIF